VASGVADRVDLCLFDETGAEDRVSLRDFDAGVWHGFVPGIEVGQRYGYRITGPYDPARGLRCDPAKLLLDPYAKALAGTVTPGPEIEGYAAPDSDAPSAADSAAKMPRSLVTSEEFAWTDDDRPAHRYEDTIIYEAHVKGLTMRHPDVPPPLRGSYAGLAHEAVIGHLLDLGVTTVELLPVHESVPESFLVERGLTNYWGYNTIGYFAPHQAYSAAVRAGQPGGQVAEFKAMVNALHRAGLEVLLDVVFNHTAEGNDLGPTLCFRGLDNVAYYRLDDGDPRHYYDTTGTGNSLNAGDPVTLRLIMDSLRYWVTQMHVDGFRFDLAPTLGRQEGGFARVSAFFDLVAQDPVVSGVKLVAEPWDVGQADSYDLGRFPPLWREWNGRYRDSMRDFWRSHPVGLQEFATRFCGSADLYAGARRRPTASVNLITVPLVLGGDEMGRTQLGNNNAYCQDNELTWFDWARADRELLEFTRRVIALRKAHPVFRRRRFLAGTDAADLRWFTPAGSPMSPAEWSDDSSLAIALYLDGSDAPDRAADGTLLVDDDFLVLVNAWWEPLDFVLADPRAGAGWHVEVDTFGPGSLDPGTLAGPDVAGRAGDKLTVGPRSITVLRSPRPQA
jgi:pullulanase/glycogen debranching enzyme